MISVRFSMVCLAIACIASPLLAAGEREFLPDSVALPIVREYARVCGLDMDGASASSTDSPDSDYHYPRCGTSAMLDFQAVKDQLDPRLLGQLSTADPLRPDLPSTFLSPGGKFAIHYATSGNDAVYQAGVDANANGVPDYVDAVARIADSVYQFEIGTLGYPVPPVDTGIIEGGDARFDIYLKDLPGNLFGLTYIDPESVGPGDFIATSYCVLENDYSEFPNYAARPLDAIRVTFAHEYFHAIQFGIDAGEMDVVGGVARRYWMEMTAVWMEEQAYDNINDYYGYLRYFLDSPRRSLQQFFTGDLHPYGAALFPLYLSQRFDRDIIRRIWQRCTLAGGNALSAINEEIVATSAGANLTIADALAEFGTWNYFTGAYAAAAPAGIGYEERANYPAIPDSSIFRESHYPFFRKFSDSSRQAQFNGVSYISFDQIQQRSTSVYRCDSTVSGNCVDSTEVMTLGAVFGTGNTATRWGLSILYEDRNLPDSFTVETFSIPDGADTTIDFENPDRFGAITMVVAPATIDPNRYRQASPPNYMALFGYGISADTAAPVPLQANRPAAVLHPYPNPAVVGAMPEALLHFKFVSPTSDSGSLAYQTPHLAIDIYTATGDFVTSLDENTPGVNRFGVGKEGIYETTWDMKNQSGQPVAGGVYLAVAKLFSDSRQKVQLAEAKEKLLIVR